MKGLLNKYGYQNAESILNEWNYVRDWADPLDYISVIKGIKGAAFCAAVMCAAQNCDNLDMLMYYDARVEKTWNGMFSSDTLLPLKGYYPFKMFNELYKLNNAVEVKNDTNLLSAAAVGDNKAAIIFTHFCDDDKTPTEKVKLNMQGFGGENGVKASYYLLDSDKDLELVKEEILSGDSFATVLESELYSSYLVILEKI